MMVVVPKDAGLARAEIDGHSFTPDTASGRDTVVACVTRDCRSKTIRLTFASRAPIDLTIGEQRYSLPPDGAKLGAARPATATKHQSGDTTLIFGKLRVP
jgi:hypothetical protein